MPVSPTRVISKRNMSLALPIALFMGTLSVSAFAEEEGKAKADKSQRIEMVVVTGYATAGLDAAITAEQMQERVVTDMADMFRINPVISAGGAVSSGQKMVVRNMGEDALNIAIDGASQTNGVFHHAGRISLDPQLLKRVEIEVGPGSATAGPGALGGSVNFITKDPSDLLDGERHYGGLIRGNRYSNGSSNKISGTLFGEIGDFFSGMASVGKSDRGTLTDANGDDILGSASEQSIGFVKAVFDLPAGQSLSVSHEDIEETGDIPYKAEWTIGDSRNETTFSDTEINRTTTTVNYALMPLNNDWLDLKATVYKSKNTQVRDYGGQMGVGHGTTESTGLNLQNTSHVQQHSFVYGINYRDDRALFSDNYQEKDAAGDWVQYPSFSDESGGVTGIFVQDVIDLLDSKLTISTGARYDRYDFTSEGGETFDDAGASLNISANYVIAEGLATSVGYAEALRGVEAADPYKSVSVSGYEPGLASEKADNLEWAIEYERGNFTSALGVFRSTISDAIVAAAPARDGTLIDPVGGTVSVAPWGKYIVNLDADVETEGFSVDLGYHTPTAGVSASYLNAETTIADEIVTRYLWAGKLNSLGDTLVLNAYWNVTHSLKFSWALESVQAINNITQTKHVGGESLVVNKPGYSVHDIYINWVPFEDHLLSVDLAFKNVLNKQYRSHAAVADHSNNAGWEGIRGQFDPGRDIRLSVGYQF